MPCQETDPEALWYGVWFDVYEVGTTTPCYEFTVFPEDTYQVDFVYTVDPLFQDPAGVTFPFLLDVDISCYDIECVGISDYYSMFNTQVLSIPAPGVLGNDINPNPEGTLAAVLLTDVEHGTLALNADGSFTYEADTGFVGVDTFTYEPQLEGIGGFPALVTIDVAAAQPCLAVDDTRSCPRNNNVGCLVLQNDLDYAGGGLTIVSTQDVTGPIDHVVIEDYVNPPYTQRIRIYTKTVGGTGSFTYTIEDVNGATSTATVVVTVT